MKGDVTRFRFDPERRYATVVLQQGRVQLDADSEGDQVEAHWGRLAAVRRLLDATQNDAEPKVPAEVLHPATAILAAERLDGDGDNGATLVTVEPVPARYEFDAELVVRIETFRSAGEALASAGLVGYVISTADDGSTEVRFGDGRHGPRPESGAIVSADYGYAGGSAGHVGAGSIGVVDNPGPTAGGDDARARCLLAGALGALLLLLLRRARSR